MRILKLFFATVFGTIAGMNVQDYHTIKAFPCELQEYILHFYYMSQHSTDESQSVIFDGKNYIHTVQHPVNHWNINKVKDKSILTYTQKNKDIVPFIEVPTQGRLAGPNSTGHVISVPHFENTIVYNCNDKPVKKGKKNDSKKQELKRRKLSLLGYIQKLSYKNLAFITTNYSKQGDKKSYLAYRAKELKPQVLDVLPANQGAYIEFGPKKSFFLAFFEDNNLYLKTITSNNDKPPVIESLDVSKQLPFIPEVFYELNDIAYSPCYPDWLLLNGKKIVNRDLQAGKNGHYSSDFALLYSLQEKKVLPHLFNKKLSFAGNKNSKQLNYIYLLPEEDLHKDFVHITPMQSKGLLESLALVSIAYNWLHNSTKSALEGSQIQKLLKDDFAINRPFKGSINKYQAHYTVLGQHIEKSMLELQ